MKFTNMKNKYLCENKVMTVKVATIQKLAGSIFGRTSIRWKPIRKTNSLFQGKVKNLKKLIKICNQSLIILKKLNNKMDLQIHLLSKKIGRKELFKLFLFNIMKIK
jgi:hypothetical protein